MPFHSFGHHQSAVLSRKAATSEAAAALALFTIAVLVIATYRGCPAHVGPLTTPRMPLESIKVSAQPLPAEVKYGNGLLDGRGHGGWFVGHFMDEGTLSQSDDVEVKFSVNPTGRRNEAAVANIVSRSMTILVSGKHRVEFGNSSVLLERPGDYCIWAGTAHSWQSVRESTVLTVRWPSLQGDQVPAAQRASAA
jgi:hypothetical protein